MNGLKRSGIGLLIFVVTSLLIGTEASIIFGASLAWALATFMTMEFRDD